MKLRTSLLFVLFLASPAHAVMRYIDGEPLPTEDRSALNENFKKVDREFRNVLRSNADARPAADSIFNLGASGTEWANLYVDRVIVSTSHSVIAYTGNGRGSTNTRIRRFTTSLTVGTAITYADSAANGSSFTINQAGWYAMSYTDFSGAGNHEAGISLNSDELTTNITNISPANNERVCSHFNASNQATFCGATLYLNSGDVIRAHVSIVAQSDGNDNTLFRITKVQ